MLNSTVFKLTKFHYLLIKQFKPTKRDVENAIRDSKSYSKTRSSSKSKSSSSKRNS